MKNRLLSLLNEIKEVCNEHDIPFFLSGELALRAYRHEESREFLNEITIMVFADNVEQLIELLQRKRADRVVESLKNNAGFPGFYLRYMDSSTTLCNCEDPTYNYETNAIGVDIEIICGKNTNGFRNKTLNVLRKKWHTEHKALYITKTMRGRKYFFSELAHKVDRILFRAVFNRKNMQKLFDAWTSQSTKNSCEYLVALNNGKLVTMDPKWFDSVKTVDIDGEYYPVVNDLYAFTKVIYPKGPKYKPSVNEFYDLDVPWEQYRKVLTSHHIDLNAIQKKQKKNQLWKKRAYTPFLKKRTHYYYFLFCSGDRVKFYKEYQGEKTSKILELYNLGKYHDIVEEMEDYFDAIQLYNRWDIGFCFEQSLFEVAMKTMIQQAVEEYVDGDIFKRQCKKILKIIKNVPAEHLDPSPNIYSGERRDKSTLEQEKEKVYNTIEEICDSYNNIFCEE